MLRESLLATFALEERSPTAADAESEHRMIQQIVNLKMKRNAHSFRHRENFANGHIDLRE